MNAIEPRPAADMELAAQIFMALRPLATTQELADAPLQGVADECVTLIRRFQKSAAIDIDQTICRLPKKAEALYKELTDRHNLPVTIAEAITALPAYWLSDAVTVAAKLTALIEATQRDYEINLNHRRLLSPPFLRMIARSKIDRPLRNFVQQQQLLAQHGIVIEPADYLTTVAFTGDIQWSRPQHILSAAHFLLNAHRSGRLKSDGVTPGDVIYDYLPIIHYSQLAMASATVHMALQPMLLPRSPLANCAFATLANKYRAQISRELVQMLGGDRNRAIIDSARDVSHTVATPLRDSARARQEMLVMLARLNFLYGYTIDLKSEPPEFAALKEQGFGGNSIMRQKQTAYAVRYFGDAAADWSHYEIYCAVVASPQWRAVIEPAQRAQERRAAAKLATDRLAGDRRVELIKAASLSNTARRSAGLKPARHPPRKLW